MFTGGLNKGLKRISCDWSWTSCVINSDKLVKTGGFLDCNITGLFVSLLYFTSCFLVISLNKQSRKQTHHHASVYCITYYRDLFRDISHSQDASLVIKLLNSNQGLIEPKQTQTCKQRNTPLSLNLIKQMKAPIVL